jgi:class 3 adenylate cyclase/tetratricopeptide (TPR) repeat protein
VKRICPTCGRTNGVAASFCSRCGSRVDDEALEWARIRAEEDTGYFPRDLAHRFLSTDTEDTGDQRQVTILFVDLVQSTQILQRLGREEMADLLDELFDGIAHAVNHVGGTVAELSGDGAFCLFGAPIVHEDDPERALRAALAIQRLVADLHPMPLTPTRHQPRVRVAVHSGTVVLRVVGHAYRLGYEPVGDAVNLAQRLQMAARPGEILVSATTQMLTSSLFRFGEPRDLTLKGFDGSHAAFPLLGEQTTAERRSLNANDATFVGRAEDLATVRQRRNELALGVGGIITIWGDAGIGKSRLLAEARRHAPSAITWLEGRSLSYAQNTPYSIISQMIRRAAQIDEADPEQAARLSLREFVSRSCGRANIGAVYPYLASAMGMKMESRDETRLKRSSSEALQTKTLKALIALVKATAGRQPIVLIFEDMHWCDRASIAALDGLLPLAEDYPILYVLVARPDTDAPSWSLRQKIETTFAHHHTSINLGPLSPAASIDLAMQLLSTDRLTADLRALFLEKAEGVPLFLEELARSLVEQGALRRSNGSWQLTASSQDLRIPPTVQGIILARLDRLGTELKRILQAAAVLGPTVSYQVLAHVVDNTDALAARLRDLQRFEFLRETRRQPESVYVFKHSLIRDVAYQSMRERRRRYLHQRAAEAIETVFSERLSEYQTIIAEHFLRAGAWPQAADYLLQAGDESTRLHAHAEARLHYAKAAEALTHLPDTLDNRRRQVDAVVKRAAVSYIAEPPELNLRRLGDGEALVNELLTSGGGAPEDRARMGWLHYWTGRVNHIRGNPLEAMEYFKQAIGAALEGGDARLTTVATMMIGQALAASGQWGKAEAPLRMALPILQRSGELREWCLASGYLGVALAASGEYEQGLAKVQESVDRALELRGWNLIASTRTLMCVTLVVNERMRELEAEAQRVIEAAERAGEQIVRYLGLGFRGWAEGRLGRHVAARASLEQQRNVGAALGQLVLADWFAVAEADIALCAGEVDNALALAEVAVLTARRASGVFSEGLAHRVWARALAAATPPDHETAYQHLRSSLGLLASGEARLQVAHTHLAWGEICRDTGDHTSASEHFGAAAAQFKASNVAEELRKAQALLRGLNC